MISLFGFPAGAAPAGSYHSVDGIVHLISAVAAEHLRTLSERFELVWCTGWEEKADEYLTPLLGLPERLPHLVFDRDVGRVHAHWKLDAIEAYAGARALAWIDDALDDSCHAWAAARAAPTLLVATLPERGITEAEVALLLRFASDVERDHRR